MANATLEEVQARSTLAGSNKFEILVFRLGVDANARRELFGINVFKVREALVMPEVTAIPGTPAHVMGVANIRGQVIPVIDLPAVVGYRPAAHNILIVTEFERSVQGFAVEEVEQITRLDWSDVLSAEAHAVGGNVTSIARMDAKAERSRLALVLDVEKILRDVLPDRANTTVSDLGPQLPMAPGSVVLAVDDSFVARSQIEKVLQALHAPFVMARTGAEAWQRLQDIQHAARSDGVSIHQKVALVLTDLEMPEMDGFTLARRIKEHEALRELPVLIHSSLTGQANEEHARSVGADGYVSKFAPDELAASMRSVLNKARRDTDAHA